MSTAVHSTLLAISHDHASTRRFALLAMVMVAMPVAVGVQAMGAEGAARAVPP
ncbi:MAG: hypothetical protein JSR28_19220, partial [Proteobacteria bacterium]|nr:hypothetical protein [Pseudomonadota bacterium]